ncbi:MAG: amidohydrolase family protein [Candidatus Jordarchaeum sp.]|uniref:amidohydrolase family protein n=1 Tax=Candidatus Jordarchaeum sp. TaxID=2823881 RepID=UPI00404AD7B7
MLEFEEIESKKIHRFYIVDAHHHLGADVDGHSNRNPVAPGGTFDFYVKVGKQLSKLFSNKPHIFRFSPLGFLNEIVRNNKKWKDTLNGTWVVDQTVVFPFNDEFKWRDEDEGKAIYWRSNDNIARWVTRAPYSLRLIGFGRVVPAEGELAVNELHRMVETLGLRGLKVHPRSDGWSGEIVSIEVKNILVEAAKLNIPVLFDTRGFGQVLDIHEVTRMARGELQSIDKALVYNLKVILAHIGFHLGHHELFTVLSHPNIYGDTSGVHDAGIPRLFEEAKEILQPNLGRYRNWSEKILFGTDYNYFDVPHAVQFISYVLSKDFPGGTEDAQRVLGSNLLKLVPPFKREIKTNFAKINVAMDLAESTERTLAKEVAVQVGDESYELSSIDFFIDPHPNFKVRPRDFKLTISRKKNEHFEDINLIVISLLDMLTIARLDNNMMNSLPIKNRILRYDDAILRRSFYEKLWPESLEIDPQKMFEFIKSITKTENSN